LARKGFRFVGEVQEQCDRERLPVREVASAPQRTDGPEAARNKIDRPERRQLSVMICNLIGVGALSSERDPEDLLAVMSSYQDRIKAFAGDGFISNLGNDCRLFWIPSRA
jgi:hypothetical protein